MVLSLTQWYALGDNPLYYTDKLAKIGKKLDLQPEFDSVGNLLLTPAHASADTLALTHRGYPLIVRYDSLPLRRITHIGYRIFNPDLALQSRLPVFDFLERYALDCALKLDSLRNTDTRIETDGLYFENCNLSNLPKLGQDSTLRVAVTNFKDKEYRVIWRNADDDDVASVYLPIEYSLLAGTDMDENERRLPQELILHKVRELADDISSDTLTNEKPYLKLETDSIFGFQVSKGENKFVDGLTSERYYLTDSIGVYPVCSVAFPAQTVANLLTGTDVPADFDIDVKMRKYNFKSEEFTLPVRQMVDYFLSMGCTPYYGTIDLNDKELIGEVVYSNSDWGYCHAMKVTVPLDTLAAGSGKMKGRLVSFIPVSRIKNLFYDKR